MPKLVHGFHFCVLTFAFCLLPCFSNFCYALTRRSRPTSPPSRSSFPPTAKNSTSFARTAIPFWPLTREAEQVTAHVAVGHKPKGLAISPDGKTLYVSNEWSDTVTEIDAATFAVKRTLKTGWGPVGLVTDRRGKTLYVANSIADSVSLIDLASGAEIKRFVTHRYPEQMLLSRDGRGFTYANILPHLGPYDQPPVSEVLCHRHRQSGCSGAHSDSGRHRDCAISRKRRLTVASISDRHSRRSCRPNARDQPGGDLLVPLMQPKNLGPLIQVSQGWMMTHGMAVVHPDLHSPLGEAQSKVTQVVLDDIDYYFATNSGVAFSPDGRRALVTSADADVVSILDTAHSPNACGKCLRQSLPYRLDSAATFVDKRLPTGHNPTSVAVSPDNRWAYVTNRLDDSVTVVDLAQAKVDSTIDLGGPKEITLMRRGEQAFHNAKVCFQGQFACGTCHPNSHLDGFAWNH